MSSNSTTASQQRTPEVQPVAPKYEQVRQHLYSQIRNRKLPVGKPLPSESELMDWFSVSRVTVRRALQCLTRDGIIQSEQGVGHLVRRAEANPPVGIIFGNNPQESLKNPSYQLILAQLQRVLANHSYANQIYFVRSHHAELRSDYDQLLVDIRKGVMQGLIAVAWPCGEKDDVDLIAQDARLLDLIRDNEIPLVGLTGAGLAGAVAIDYVALGRSGAQHFLDQGVDDIGLIAGVDAISEQPDAVRGFCEALTNAGHTINTDNIVRVKELSQQAGYAAMRRIAALPRPPRAIVVADDVIARGVMSAILEMGVGVTGEVQLATLYIRGTGMFFPRPYVRLEVDEQFAAEQVVDQLIKILRNPHVALESISCVPVVRMHQEDAGNSDLDPDRLLDLSHTV